MSDTIHATHVPGSSTFQGGLVRKIVAGLALALAAALGGCSEDGGVGPDLSHVGTFQLQTVMGNPLPAVVEQVGSDKLEVTAGAVTLNQNGTFNSSITLRETIEGSATTTTETSSGTFVRTNNAISLTTTDGDAIAGSLSGGTLTLTAEGIVLVFKK